MSPAAMTWVFFGGGIGAVLRYIIVSMFTKAGVVSSAPAFPHNFPWAVLLINISGSFAIGILGQIVSRETFSNYTFLQSFLIVGILGGFTTFSAFSFEALSLFQSGKFLYAAAYIICSVVFSIAAAYIGYTLAK